MSRNAVRCKYFYAKNIKDLSQAIAEIEFYYTLIFRLQSGSFWPKQNFTEIKKKRNIRLTFNIGLLKII